MEFPAISREFVLRTRLKLDSEPEGLGLLAFYSAQRRSSGGYLVCRALSSSVLQASRQAAAIVRPRGPCFLFSSRCITTPCSIIMIGYATCAARLSSTPARTRWLV